MKRVVVVGATGIVGQAVMAAFREMGDEVIAASRNSQPPLDIEDPASITSFFAEVGPVDAIASATGSVPFLPLHEATDEDFMTGFRNKLQGQINLVLYGRPFLNKGGSVTLSTGILNHHPVAGSVISSTVNGALEIRPRIRGFPRLRTLISSYSSLIRASAHAKACRADLEWDRGAGHGNELIELRNTRG